MVHSYTICGCEKDKPDSRCNEGYLKCNEGHKDPNGVVRVLDNKGNELASKSALIRKLENALVIDSDLIFWVGDVIGIVSGVRFELDNELATCELPDKELFKKDQFTVECLPTGILFDKV